MSVQFGRWSLDGGPVATDYLERVSAFIAPYGPDAADSYAGDGFAVLYHALHTNKESRSEVQPHLLPRGEVLTWDGRLDNREELIGAIGRDLPLDAADVAIVAAAYDCWGSACFPRLLGDWAISILNPRKASLILAKDFLGTRHLYYDFEERQITWSTLLDPLVLFADRAFALDEEYLAGWFSSFPAADLTPYRGIHSVPPASFLELNAGKLTVTKYWNFDPAKRIRYRTHTEYEDHFRTVFAESVRHRLRSDSPILAELSGGVDSSSIVCMADTLIAAGTAQTPRLHTVSYYDDSEPSWNERSFFSKVEEKRGCKGCWIEVGSNGPFQFQSVGHPFPVTPSSGRVLSEAGRQFATYMVSQRGRVLLSGIGGDEVAGGVSTPVPELQDLIAAGRFRDFARQLKAWALSTRKPWFHLFFEAARGFFPCALFGVPAHREPPTWLCTSFVKRHRAALTGHPSRVKLCGPQPSFLDNISTLEALRRRFGCHAMTSDPPYETRYPYLDRNLLQFLFALPRELLVRPHQRRALMRKALAGIVPDEILNRKRKAFIARAPLVALSADWPNVVEMTRNMVSASLGIVDPKAFADALDGARNGREIHIVAMLRTFAIERWLRAISPPLSMAERSASQLRERSTVVLTMGSAP